MLVYYIVDLAYQSSDNQLAIGCQQSLDWTTGLDYWTDQFYHKIDTCGLKTFLP